MPKRILWQRSIDDNLLMADGMLELDVTGKERDASIGIATPRTVFEIAFDGATDGGELAANLMMAPC